MSSYDSASRNTRTFYQNYIDLLSDMPQAVHKATFKQIEQSFTAEEAVQHILGKRHASMQTTDNAEKFLFQLIEAKMIQPCASFFPSGWFPNDSQSMKSTQIFCFTQKSKNLQQDLKDGKFWDFDGKQSALLYLRANEEMDLSKLEFLFSFLISHYLTRSLNETLTEQNKSSTNTLNQQPLLQFMPIRKRQKGFFMTGIEMVEWLLWHTSLTKRSEAQFLAQLLNRTGFFYGVKKDSENVEQLDQSSVNLKLSLYGKKVLMQSEYFQDRPELCSDDLFELSPIHKSSTQSFRSRIGTDDSIIEKYIQVEKRLSVGSNLTTPITTVTSESTKSSEVEMKILKTETINRRNSDDQQPLTHVHKLKEVLETPELLSLFYDFMRKQFSEENLLFWLEVENFKQSQNIQSDAQKIQTAYFKPNARFELNIDSKMSQRVLQVMEQGVHKDMFEFIQKYIFDMMAAEGMLKFARTEAYKQWQDNSTEKKSSKRLDRSQYSFQLPTEMLDKETTTTKEKPVLQITTPLMRVKSFLRKSPVSSESSDSESPPSFKLTKEKSGSNLNLNQKLKASRSQGLDSAGERSPYGSQGELDDRSATSKSSKLSVADGGGLIRSLSKRLTRRSGVEK